LILKVIILKTLRSKLGYNSSNKNLMELDEATIQVLVLYININESILRRVEILLL
jgi:hypothetical protein